MRCFGFAPLRLPADLDFSGMFHGVDERVPVAALQFGTRVLDGFLDRCCTPPAPDPRPAANHFSPDRLMRTHGSVIVTHCVRLSTPGGSRKPGKPCLASPHSTGNGEECRLLIWSRRTTGGRARKPA